MSKRVSKDSYEKTLSYRFTRWLNGEKDPLLGEVEMKPQVAENENDEKRAIRQERRRWDILLVFCFFSLGNGSCNGPFRKKRGSPRCTG